MYSKTPRSMDVFRSGARRSLMENQVLHLRLSSYMILVEMNYAQPYYRYKKDPGIGYGKLGLVTTMICAVLKGSCNLVL